MQGWELLVGSSGWLWNAAQSFERPASGTVTYKKWPALETIFVNYWYRSMQSCLHRLKHQDCFTPVTLLLEWSLPGPFSGSEREMFSWLVLIHFSLEMEDRFHSQRPSSKLHNPPGDHKIKYYLNTMVPHNATQGSRQKQLYCSLVVVCGTQYISCFIYCIIKDQSLSPSSLFGQNAEQTKAWKSEEDFTMDILIFTFLSNQMQLFKCTENIKCKYVFCHLSYLRHSPQLSSSVSSPQSSVPSQTCRSSTQTSLLHLLMPGGHSKPGEGTDDVQTEK